MGVGSVGSLVYSSKRVLDNVENLGREFTLSPSGRFGVQGENEPRIVKSAKPQVAAERFWEVLKKGADTVSVKEGKNSEVKIATFGKYSFITYRPVTSSKDGSPGIAINDRGPSGFIYNLHFVPLD